MNIFINSTWIRWYIVTPAIRRIADTQNLKEDFYAIIILLLNYYLTC